MIAITDEIVAKTVEGIVTDSSAIRFSGSTVNAVLTEIKNGQQFKTTDQWDEMPDGEKQDGVLYFVYEE